MIIVVLALLGLIFGSFVNALVWRLHEQAGLPERPQKGSASTKHRHSQNLSILSGRSMCPNCRHELAAKDLVPIVSWLWLRGKCRYCAKPIAWQYPLIELATAVLFVLSYIWWPLALNGVGLFQLIVWLFCVVVFLALAVYDLRWTLLPNKLVYPLIAITLAETIVVAIAGHSWTLIWQPLVGGLIISGLFYALFQISGGGWIGGGDVKLAFALGLLAATPLKSCLLIFLASLLGTLISLPLVARNKRNLKLRVPFGPFLLAATVVVVLFGTQIVHWYTRTLL